MLENVSCAVPYDWAFHFSQCLYDWQTLITGLLALGVGSATVWMVRRQIDHQDQIFAAGRRSRFAVAKAKTPLAAIEIHEHAKIYIAEAENLLPFVLARSRQGFSFDGPAFPRQAESILDALVETSEDPILIDQVSALYSEQQVLASRLSDVPRPADHSLTIDDYILQPIMMDAIAMNLLAFGRDDVAMPRLDWSAVESSARRLIRDATARDRVLGHIADKRGRDRPVPLALRRQND